MTNATHVNLPCPGTIAISPLTAAGHRGPLWTFVVHGREPAQRPDRRIALTDSELQTKHAILVGYQSGVSPIHDRLAATYSKPEELFWSVPLDDM
ncbi:MAG: hypothetical protein H6822_28795 [Planctomycetaceae bacterium]|nr:hypothetical protein [Planctomycetales bacterium]MCB9926181.1 hypothetical protein [Planctomycetaceae bacterium]